MIVNDCGETCTILVYAGKKHTHVYRCSLLTENDSVIIITSCKQVLAASGYKRHVKYFGHQEGRTPGQEFIDLCLLQLPAFQFDRGHPNLVVRSNALT